MSSLGNPVYRTTASDRATREVEARLARFNNHNRPLLAYVLIKENCVIGVHHADLDKSWWRRGLSRDEGLARRVENVICGASGLKRVWRCHIGGWVFFRVRKELFEQVAVAVRLSFDQDEVYVSFGKATWERHSKGK